MKALLNEIEDSNLGQVVVHFVCQNCEAEFVSDEYTISGGTDDENTDYYVDDCPKCNVVCSTPVAGESEEELE